VTLTFWLLIYLLVGLLWARWITLIFLARPGSSVRITTFFLHLVLWPAGMLFIAAVWAAFVLAHRRRPSAEAEEPEREPEPADRI
jgi:hypothetical protein